MQFTNTLLTILPLVGLISAAPAADASDASSKPYVAVVEGLPKQYFPNTTYITYTKDFFGDDTLQPSMDKSTAVNWTVNKKSDLVSSVGNTIALTPPYARPQAQSISYVAYNGTQGTYVKGGKKEILNHSPDFGSWRFCESQYGSALEYETPGFNNSNAGEPFPCYPVKFFLEH